MVVWRGPPAESPRLRKETWTVVTLVIWSLWRHRNDIVFNRAVPSEEVVLRRIDIEGQDWKAASLLGEDNSFPTRVDRWTDDE